MSIPKNKQEGYNYKEPADYRHCKKCKELVSKDLFYKDKSQWDGLDRVCKHCNLDRMVSRRYAKKLAIVEYLGGACVKCGATLEDIHWTAFDCNHIDPSQKSFAIGSAGHNIENIKDELDKCELVCSNCHRKITHEDIRNKYTD